MMSLKATDAMADFVIHNLTSYHIGLKIKKVSKLYFVPKLHQ